jgi:glycosyltransferase involved in cell wall biosynthesis
MAVRRSLVKRSLRRVSDPWFINPVASQAPDWWAGWPDGKRLAFVITHDVERTKGLDRCRRVAELEMRLGFRSSFNFVPEGEYQVPKSLLEFLTDHGFEVGVHDLRHDGTLYSSRKNFRQSAQRINDHLAEWGAVGFRSAFMLHDLDWLRDLNILYDSSTFDVDPFEPQPDGANTIFPFRVGRDDGSSYVELPYTLPQDSTLFLILRESAIDIWRQKLDWVAEHGGLALVNVHPDYISLDGTRSPLEFGAHLYEDFLEYAAQRYQRDAWFALAKDVAAYVQSLNSRSVHPRRTFASSSYTVSRPSVGHSDNCSPVDVHSHSTPTRYDLADQNHRRLHGKRVAMVMFSFHPIDPRPRRAADALASMGMKVDLICLKAKKHDPTHEIHNGIDILRLSVSHSRGSAYSYMYQYSRFLITTAAILSARTLVRSYDLVYVHNMPDILVFSALLPKLCGAKVILDIHDPMPELMMTIKGLEPQAPSVRLLKWLEKKSLAFADSAVTVNRACERLFVSRGCPPGKITVIMNSPDERIFRFQSPHTRTTLSTTPRKPFVIMFHGSLLPRNGLDLAVDALAIVRQSIPDAVLRIYGWQTPFLDLVMDSVRARGLQDAVEYLGTRSQEELVEKIKECDIGVIPNHRSIFAELNTPTRIFEYLALGKPVIAPRAAGIRDYFRDGSLIFFELGNAQDLAQKIEYAFSHPIEISEIVRRGQEVYQEHLWHRERLRFIGVVARLLNTGVAQSDSTGIPDRSTRSTALPRSVSD